MRGARGDAGLEMAIGRVLRAGVVLSTVALALGLLLALVPGGAAASHRLLTVGLVVLLATPAGRVVISVVEYAMDRDWTFVALTLVVLAELAAGVFAAMH